MNPYELEGKIMNIKSMLNNSLLKLYYFFSGGIPLFLLTVTVYLLILSPTFAEGVNRLEGLRGDVSKTFGAGSDVQYFILLAEGIGGAIAFSKSKNYMVLAGVPTLMMFTHWALK